LQFRIFLRRFIMENRGKPGLLGAIEEKLGLPSLNQVAKGFQKFPDMPRLREIKSIVQSCERLAESGPELDKVVVLVSLIADTPNEKLEKLEKVLKQANKLVKEAPDELLEFLSSLKE